MQIAGVCHPERPVTRSARLALVLLSLFCGSIFAQTSPNDYALAEKLYRSGNLSQAEPLYLHIAPDSSHYPMAQLRLGTIYYLTARPALAETRFKAYLAYRQSPEVYCLLAGAQFNQQKFDEAALSAHKALRLDQEFAKAYTVLGMIHTAEHEWSLAKTDYTKAIKLNPKDADTWFMLGQALYLRNRFAEAARSFKEALKINPNRVRSYAALARSQDAMGDISGAKQSFQEGIIVSGKEDVFQKDIYLQYADFLLKLGRLKASQATVEAALRIAPQDFGLHYELGKVFFRMGRLTDAAFQEETALRLDGKNYRVDFLLAQIYTALRQPKEAARYAALAVQATPQSSR